MSILSNFVMERQYDDKGSKVGFSHQRWKLLSLSFINEPSTQSSQDDCWYQNDCVKYRWSQFFFLSLATVLTLLSIVSTLTRLSGLLWVLTFGRTALVPISDDSAIAPTSFLWRSCWDVIVFFWRSWTISEVFLIYWWLSLSSNRTMLSCFSRLLPLSLRAKRDALFVGVLCFVLILFCSQISSYLTKVLKMLIFHRQWYLAGYFYLIQLENILDYIFPKNVSENYESLRVFFSETNFKVGKFY